MLHDGPTDDVDEVWVEIDRVSAHHDTLGWIEVSDAPQTIDLLSLQDGVVAELGLAELPAGAYSQLRLHLVDSWVIAGGARDALTVPSGEQSGVKLIHGFDIPECGDVTLTLDWDVGAHLTHSAHHGYKLRPTLVVETTDVDDSSCGGECSNDGSAGTIALSAETIYAAAKHPTMITNGDLDGDGDEDLVVPTWATRAVSVYLNNGDGTFAPQQRYFYPDWTSNAALADVDGDGVLDMIVTYRSAAAVHLGNGDGTFAPFVSYATGASPGAIATADFDGDGVVDFAAANYLGNSLSVFLGTGGGNFAGAIAVPVDVGPLNLEAADLDHDGNTDLVAMAASPRRIDVLLGNGDGTFAALPPIENALYGGIYGNTALADLDCDDNLDLVMTSFISAEVATYRGNGDGTFGAPTRFATGDRPAGPVVRDLNGDGTQDILVVNAISSDASLLWGLGNADFSPETRLPLSGQPNGAVVEDLDGDGVLDLAVPYGPDAAMGVSLGLP